MAKKKRDISKNNIHLRRMNFFMEVAYGGVAEACAAMNIPRENIDTYFSKDSIPGPKLQANLLAIGCNIAWLMSWDKEITPQGMYAENEAGRKLFAELNPEEQKYIRPDTEGKATEDEEIIKSAEQLGKMLELIGIQMQQQGKLLKEHSKSLDEHNERIDFIEKHLRLTTSVEVGEKKKRMVAMTKPNSSQHEEKLRVGKAEHSK